MEETGIGFHLSVRDKGKLLEFCHGIISVQTNLFVFFFPQLTSVLVVKMNMTAMIAKET